MARELLFVVQPFNGTKDALVPAAPMAAKSESEAKARARNISHRYAGVVAYSRFGDAELGEYDEPIVLAKFGNIPSRSTTSDSASRLPAP